MSIFSSKNKTKPNKKENYLSDEYSFTERVKTKLCDICGTVNKENAKFCTKCSSSLIDIICPICMTSNKFDQHYCIKCKTILQNKRRG